MSKPISRGDVIRRALSLIDNEKTWTQGAYAADCHGRDVEPMSPRAVRWCAHGALEKAAIDLTGNGSAAFTIVFKARDELDRLAGTEITELNDKFGREAVVALFKRALAVA